MGFAKGKVANPYGRAGNPDNLKRNKRLSAIVLSKPTETVDLNEDMCWPNSFDAVVSDALDAIAQGDEPIRDNEHFR